MSNKKGGMYRTGTSASSASSASSNDSKKKIYPRNLQEVKSKDELLSLLTWVKLIKNKYADIRKSHRNNRYAHHTRENFDSKYKRNKENLNTKSFNAFTSRKELRERVLIMLEQYFIEIPYDSKELNYLINYIINDEESGFGPYADKEYFVNIWKNALQMRKTHGSDSQNDWEPDVEDTKNFDLWFGNSGTDFICEKPHYLDIYNKEYEIKGPQVSPRGVNL